MPIYCRKNEEKEQNIPKTDQGSNPDENLSRDLKGTLRTPHAVDYEFSKTQAFKGKLIGENVVGRGV